MNFSKAVVIVLFVGATPLGASRDARPDLDGCPTTQVCACRTVLLSLIRIYLRLRLWARKARRYAVLPKAVNPSRVTKKFAQIAKKHAA